MKIKTCNLIGKPLDWAVAKARGCKPQFNMVSHGQTWRGWWITAGTYNPMGSPSTDWSQAGPIIERESMRLTPDQGATYVDCVWFAGSANEDGDEFNGEGPTPLIAAMRCYVASKLGNEIDIPEELA